MYTRWSCDLDKILAQISLFEKDALPSIEKDLGYPFRNRNLVLTAMMQSGNKNTFSRIQKQSGQNFRLPISPTDLGFLITSSDIADSLAWIGDTAINYAVLSYIWEPGITTEKLHKKRESFETNKNLSGLCDVWNLYRYRFFQDSVEPKEKTLNKIKGTLTEAIFGVIFIEQDLPGIQKALHLIDPTLKGAI